MKRLVYTLFLLIPVLHTKAAERIIKDREANNLIHSTRLLRYTDQSALPNYLEFIPNQRPSVVHFDVWLRVHLQLSNSYQFIELERSNDELGMTHIRLKETFEGIPVQGTMYILHTRNQKVESVSGVLYNGLENLSLQTAYTSAQCLQTALQKVNAQVYKWQLASEEAQLKKELQNPQATYFPQPEKCILKQKDGFHLCYAFNIYAQEPFGRTMEYVDAHSGQSVFSKNLIQHINSNGTAVTKYSGTQPFQTDSVSPASFRLRDASRGLGVRTYNLATATSYGGATDFTDADNYWNNVNAAHDEAATDAHWGAQKTYDYFWNKHNRNSIDGAGYLLNSYVHYNTNYANAFWDGTRMTYGDGNLSQGFLIMTGLDVCGHEIGHGLTNFTSDLSATSSGTDECDALNEAYSDVFGTAVEKYARPSQWDWIIGGDITCTSAGVPDGVGIRNMSNPTLLGQPKCYQGTNWSSSGEPHDNDGPLIYWYYLLSTGYAPASVTALGTDTAAKIAFRTNTVHLFPNADYADARFYSILSSSELYGACSTPTIATTNAWAEVCVGNPYVMAPTVSAFSGDIVQTCDTILTVQFSNNSVSGNSFIWDFGDGDTSSVYSPSHTYTTGVYTVKLYANGGTCGSDTSEQIAYIQVGPPAGPATSGATICTPASVVVSATPTIAGDSIKWYTAATGGTLLGNGNNYTTPVLSTSTTYYAEEVVSGPVWHVGPLNNSIGTGGNYTNTTRFMVFDCSQPVTLVSVWVYASSSGNRTIILKNAGGTTLQSVTVNIPTGGSVVTLNMPIPVGTGLQLGLATGSTVNLYRNSTGAVYPYTNGPISITGNTAAGSPTYYYFFYDWVIKAPDCYSVRTPATVIVATGGGSVPAVITPGAGGTTVCSPATVTLSANTGAGLSYQWYNGSTVIPGAIGAIYNASTSGNYSVVVSSSSGCLTPGTSAPVSVVVSTPPATSVTPSGPLSFCPGSVVILQANTGSGYTYQWYNGTTPISGATNANYTAVSSGSYWVQITNGSCNGNSATYAVNVSSTPVATVTPGGVISSCSGNNTTFTASSGSGYSYQWMNGTTPITGATSLTYTTGTAGSYSVIITNATGCSATSPASTLVVNPSPTASITASGATTFCSGSSVTLQTPSVPGYTYQWYNGTAIPGATNTTYTATTSGSYFLMVSNTYPCSANSNSIPVTVNNTPLATVSPAGNTTLCQGDTLLLVGNSGSGYTYQWLLNGNPISGATAMYYYAALAGNYSVVVTNSGNCSDTSSVATLTLNPIPNPVVVNTAGQLSVSGGPFTSYQWYLNGSPISGATNSVYNPVVNGDYTVLVTLNGCEAVSGIVKVSGVGITEWQSESILVHPNPVSDVLWIEGISGATYVLRNMQGQSVIKGQVPVQVSMAHLAQGVYSLQILNNEHQVIYHQKVVKE